MRNHYAEKSFEKTLQEVDDFGRKYLQYIREYFQLPQFEDIAMDKLIAEYGEEKALELASYFTSYVGQEMPDPDNPENRPDVPDANVEDMPDETPPDPKLAKEEEKFRNLCNAMCSLSGSVVISLCNIFGTALPDSNRTHVLAMLNEAAHAHLCTSNSTMEMFPAMNTPRSIVLAKRGRRHLRTAKAIAVSLLQGDKELSASFQPAIKLFEQAVKAIEDYIEAAAKLPDDFDDLPF